MAESSQKLSKLEEENFQLQSDKDEAQRANKEFRAKMIDLQAKVKKADDQTSKMKDWYVPKLQHTIKF